MKKLLTLILGATLALSVVSCGQTAEPAPQQDTSTTTDTTVDTQTSDDSTTETNGDPLVVAMELAYPPFETKDDNGDPMGISVDIITAFGEYVGRDVVIENTNWDGLIPALQTDVADVVISSMTITESRLETIDFSDPYANSMLGLLLHSDSPVESMEDMNQEGRKIAVKSGSTGHIYAENNLTETEIIILADESACVTEVAQGKVDGFIYDQLTIYRNNQANLETTKAVFIPFQDTEKWGIAVKKGNTELLEQLNAFLVEFTAEGGFDTVTETHLSEEKVAFDELGFQWFFDLT